jgi:hypothetical protein
MDNDDFALKRRPFMQRTVAGKTVAKIGWRTKKKAHGADWSRAGVIGEYGDVLATFPSTEEEEKDVTIFDGPTMIVRDVRDSSANRPPPSTMPPG